MAEQSDLAEVIKNIQADVTTIIKGEIELAKAELVPQAKAAGVGAGLFGAAAYVALSGAALLFSGLAFWLSVGFQAWFHLEILPALAWGFAVMAVLFFLLAGVLALVGKSRLTFSPPEATVANAEASLAAVKSAVAKGKADVDALSLTGRQPALEAGADTAATPGRS
ncbi:phage holin family protein [Propionicimonas sp.]|uniref:phage holin family protein n=1 Tax=Propionicimonas sp. TaxID=1955623 RepID=UPI0039E2A3DA